MQRLLYISESFITQAEANATAAEIVMSSRIRNKQFDVTGALIFTHHHFAQVLEGPPDALTKVMASIQRDQRHRNIVVIDTSSITHRQFSDLQMAYEGPSQFVSRHVTRLLQTTSYSERAHAAEWLTELARLFIITPTPVRTAAHRLQIKP